MSDASSSVGVLNRVRVQEFREVLSHWVSQYEREHNIPVPLSVINRRWGVRCKGALGISVKELIELSPDLFEQSIGRSGGMIVRAVKVSRLQHLIIFALEDAGGVLPGRDIIAALSGSGFTAGEYADEVEKLLERNILVSEGGLLKLARR